MSVTERRYFRRGSDGTRVLDHGEIRELMFANREARLEINCGLRLGVSTGDLRFQLNLVLRLRNAGRVPAAAPFLRVKEIGWKLGVGLGDIVSLRTGAERTVGFYASRDVLLHMEDEIGLAEFETGSISGGLGSRPWQVPYRLFASPDCFTRSRWWERMAGEAFRQNDYPTQVSGVFGAENAPAQSFNMEIDKVRLLDLFASYHNL